MFSAEILHIGRHSRAFFFLELITAAKSENIHIHLSRDQAFFGEQDHDCQTPSRLSFQSKSRKKGRLQARAIFQKPSNITSRTIIFISSIFFFYGVSMPLLLEFPGNVVSPSHLHHPLRKSPRL